MVILHDVNGNHLNKANLYIESEMNKCIEKGYCIGDVYEFLNLSVAVLRNLLIWLAVLIVQI